MNPAFNFSAPNGVVKKRTDRDKGIEREHHVDSVEQLSLGDTPQIERNKLMRAGHSRSTSDDEGTQKGLGKGKGKGQTKRKSSASMRGKRVSSLFEGGVICEWFLSSEFIVILVSAC
jgi:kinetochore protein Mis13/DSN1